MSTVLMRDVRDVMEKDVLSVEENTSAFDVLKKMVDRKVWSVLVTRKGLPIGVMTERDFIRRCIMSGLDSKTTPVGKLMSSPLITIEPGAPIGQALALMIDKQVRRLYVVQNGKIVGRVTQTGLLDNTINMFRALSEAWTAI